MIEEIKPGERFGFASATRSCSKQITAHKSIYDSLFFYPAVYVTNNGVYFILDLKLDEWPITACILFTESAVIGHTELLTAREFPKKSTANHVARDVGSVRRNFRVYINVTNYQNTIYKPMENTGPPTSGEF